MDDLVDSDLNRMSWVWNWLAFLLLFLVFHGEVFCCVWVHQVITTRGCQMHELLTIRSSLTWSSSWSQILEHEQACLFVLEQACWFLFWLT